MKVVNEMEIFITLTICNTCPHRKEDNRSLWWLCNIFRPFKIMSDVFMRNGTYPLMVIGKIYNNFHISFFQIGGFYIYNFFFFFFFLIAFRAAVHIPFGCLSWFFLFGCCFCFDWWCCYYWWSPCCHLVNVGLPWQDNWKWLWQQWLLTTSDPPPSPVPAVGTDWVTLVVTDVAVAVVGLRVPFWSRLCVCEQKILT